MGPGLLALIVFIVLIIIWAVVLKRSIAEAALLSLIILPFFGGAEGAPGMIVGSLDYVLHYEVLYASLAFTVMSFLLQNSNVLGGMLHIFTRLFGRLKGGPAYVNTGISSVLGCLSGGNTPNAATSGAFTANWLLESGWNREQAATLIAANGGLGAGFPPCAGLFIVLGFPTVAGFVSEGRLYVALFVTGLYQVLWRIVYIHFIVRKNKIKPTLTGEQEPIGVVFRKYGIDLTLFLGAIIPVALTMGPINEFFVNRSDAWADAMDNVNLLVWLPTLMMSIIMLLDGKNIIKRFSSWEEAVEKFIPQMSSIGGLLFFIFAASNVITKLNLADDVVAVVSRLHDLEAVRGRAALSPTVSSRTLDEARLPEGLAWRDRARDASERLSSRLGEFAGEQDGDKGADVAGPGAGGAARPREGEVRDLMGYLRDFSAGGAFSSIGGSRGSGRDDRRDGAPPSSSELWNGPFSEN